MANISILIEGIIALLFERNETGQPTACVLGVVQGVPDHVLSIKCNKDGTDVPIDTEISRLRLEVEGTTENGIRFSPGDIDRLTGEGSPDSAKWILDFENELYGEPIGVDPTRFRTVFRINNGEIFTDTISKNHLLCNNEANPHESPTFIGKVATKVGIRTDLDANNSVARLFDDTTQIVEVQPDENLEMEVSLTCPQDLNAIGQRPGHANHYYRALGNKLVFGEKQLFSSTKMPSANDPVEGPVSPEASCLVGQSGQSNPGGGS
jgi:hypothetical protein